MSEVLSFIGVLTREWRDITRDLWLSLFGALELPFEIQPEQLDVLTVCLVCVGVRIRQASTKRTEIPFLKISSIGKPVTSTLQILFCLFVAGLIAYPFVSLDYFYESVTYGINSPFLTLCWIASAVYLCIVITHWRTISLIQDKAALTCQVLQTNIEVVLSQSHLRSNSISVPANIIKEFDMLLSDQDEAKQRYHESRHLRLTAILMFVFATSFLPETFSEAGIRYFTEFNVSKIVDIVLVALLSLSLLVAFFESIRPAIRMIVAASVLLAIGYSSDALINIHQKYFMPQHNSAPQQ